MQPLSPTPYHLCSCGIKFLPLLLKLHVHLVLLLSSCGVFSFYSVEGLECIIVSDRDGVQLVEGMYLVIQCHCNAITGRTTCTVYIHVHVGVWIVQETA